MSVIDSALPQIRQLQPYSPGKPVEELERELGIREAIKLASNENPLGCSPKVVELLTSADRHVELYPDVNAFYLKQKLGQHLGVADNQITIGNGSNDVLELVARSFLDRDGNAVFSQYAFMIYAMVTQACGAQSKVAAALGADSNQPFGHDLPAMLASIDANTRIVFIANPNNPTGTWLVEDALRNFIERVPANVAIVIDEAYFEYVDIESYPDTMRWLSRYPNLIVTRTFSKIFGLAGLRLGYSVSSPELCDLFNRVRQPFNGNCLALSAAQVALDDHAFVEVSRRSNSQGLKSMRHWFSQRQLEYLPSVGNFLTVRFGPQAQQVYQQLLQQGIIVRPIANYGLPEFLRISVGTESQLTQLYAALEVIL